MKRLGTIGFLTVALTSTPAVAASPCLAASQGKESSAIKVTDIETQFPEFRQNVTKGLTVTLLHQIDFRLEGPAERQRASILFGCQLRFDLWDEFFYVAKYAFGIKNIKPRNLKNIDALPEECTDLAAFIDADTIIEVEAFTILNPVSDEQLAKTREWLAKKGIANTGGIIGRAVNALIDLKGQKTYSRKCDIVRS